MTTATYFTLARDAIGAALHGYGAVSVFARVVTPASFLGTNDQNVILYWRGGNPAVTMGFFNVQASKKLRMFSRSQTTDGFTTVVGTTVLATSTEYTLGGVVDFAGDSTRVYVNGSQEASTGTAFGSNTYVHAATPSGADSIGLGSVSLAGRLQDVTVWRGDIGTAGFLALHARHDPMNVRPDILLDTIRLIGRSDPEPSCRGILTGASSGSPAQADHLRVLYSGSARSARVLFPAWAARESGLRVPRDSVEAA